MSGSGGKLAQKILPAVIVAPVLTVLFFWTILLRRPWGGHDWMKFYHYYDWVRVSLTEHHTLPLYMPNALHTTDFLANPVSPLLGPLVWLLFLIPTGAYIKLLIAFYATAGLLGMFALLRDQGVNPETALFGSVVFAFNGFFLSHFAMGHYCFFALYLLPTLLFLFRRALLGSRGALWLAAVVNVLVIFDGSHHPFLWHNALLAIFALLTCFGARSLAPLRRWSLFLVASCGLGAVKLLPMIAAFGAYDPEQRIPGLPPAAALWSLVTRGQTLTTERPDVLFQFGSGWWEYDFYIGGLALVAILVGLVAARQAWPLMLTGCFFLAISLDVSAWWSGADVWGLLKELPAWKSQRAPSRFMVVALFAFLVVASLGLQRLVDRARSRPTAHRLLRGLMLVLALLVGLDLHWQSRVWQNVGPGVFPPHRDHVPVVRMLRAREGDTARVTQFTPHRFVVTAKSIRGGSLLLPREPISGRDQWRVSGGRITSVRERLAVTVPPGESIITFTYVARYFRLGLTITAITLVAAAISLSRGRLRARTEAGGPREGFVRSRWKATRHE